MVKLLQRAVLSKKLTADITICIVTINFNYKNYWQGILMVTFLPSFEVLQLYIQQL